MIGTVPPSALQAAPVTYDERGEHRKTITDAISSGSAKPSERPAGPDRLQHLVPRLPALLGLLVGEPARREPGVAQRRPRRDRVAADPVLRVEVGHEPRQRQHRGLGHRVVRHPRGWALAGRRGHVHDHTLAALAHPGQHRLDRADEAHHVQLPHGLPLLLGQLVELGQIRVADVVHEHVDRADLGLRAADQLRGSVRVTEIHGHMQRLAHARALPRGASR